MNYEEFQELCEEVDDPFSPTASDYFTREAEVDCSWVTELLQTGSVTVEVRGKKYVVSLQVKEAT